MGAIRKTCGQTLGWPGKDGFTVKARSFLSSVPSEFIAPPPEPGLPLSTSSSDVASDNGRISGFEELLANPPLLLLPIVTQGIAPRS